MAKKARTPPPPRRVQAPKVRTGSGRPPEGDERRRRIILYTLAVSGFAGLALAIILIATLGFGGGGSDGGATPALATTLRAAGCTFKSFPGSPPGQHVHSLTAKVRYNSFPPTSGKHYDIPALWGFYDEPVNMLQSVHNLEHGGVVIRWGSKVPQAQVEAMRTWYGTSPNGILAAPLPSLGDKIALTAWNAPPGQDGHGRLAECRRFNATAFDAFRDAYRGKGPERFPVSLLTPGS